MEKTSHLKPRGTANQSQNPFINVLEFKHIRLMTLLVVLLLIISLLPDAYKGRQ